MDGLTLAATSILKLYSTDEETFFAKHCSDAGRILSWLVGLFFKNNKDTLGRLAGILEEAIGFPWLAKLLFILKCDEAKGGSEIRLTQ
jgi:hypothetical protein